MTITGHSSTPVVGTHGHTAAVLDPALPIAFGQSTAAATVTELPADTLLGLTHHPLLAHSARGARNLWRRVCGSHDTGSLIRAAEAPQIAAAVCSALLSEVSQRVILSIVVRPV